MNYNAPEFPKRIEIELASSCNLRCVYCPRHHVDNLNGFIDLDIFKKIISEIEKYPETVYSQDYNRLFHDLLPSVCGELDPSRLYWPSSPGDGDSLPVTGQNYGSGDNHFWDVWHGEKISRLLMIISAGLCPSLGCSLFQI